MEVIIIAAVSDDGYIGKNGGIPWNIPEDMKRFRELTLGHPVIMGRKTWESLTGRLPNRLNYVLTRQKHYVAEGAFVVDSLKKAVEMAGNEEPRIEGIDYCKAYIIGGENVYREGMKFADRLEITEVHQEVKGDARFPEIGKQWEEINRNKRRGYEFVTYEAKK